MASLARGEVRGYSVRSLDLLASALAGRTVQVMPGKSGAPAWTDGRTIFIDAGIAARKQIELLAVQASLLAVGSLGPDIVRKFVRYPPLAKRYLAIEGQRALVANEALLPVAACSLIDREIAARSDLPTVSLAVALSWVTIAMAPETFGAIHARQLLAVHNSDGTVAAQERASNQSHNRALADLAEDADNAEEDKDIGRAVDFFTIPGSSGGPLGRWFQHMLAAVRQLGGDGPTGADAPTHRTRTGTRGNTAIVSAAMARMPEQGGAGQAGAKYHEWDVYRQSYRLNWCTVREVEPRSKNSTPSVPTDTYGFHRPLARLGVGLERCHRQAQGDDIDIDAAIEARVEAMAGSAPDERFYLDSLRGRRDLAVLILLDISGSAAEPGTAGQSVHEHQRGVAAALAAALYHLGDRVALYAFCSQGRFAVDLVSVKRFDDNLNARVMRRLRDLEPAAYSRLGAAIRHGTAVLRERSGTPRRLLVVLSDGLAYDHGYERVYGAADARRALSEARHSGIGCLGLTIGASTEVEALRRVFGSAAHATIAAPEQLRHVIGPLFRSALRSAEIRRRV